MFPRIGPCLFNPFRSNTSSSLKRDQSVAEKSKWPCITPKSWKRSKSRQIKLINKRSIYTTCLACKRKINEISQQKSLKCKKNVSRGKKSANEMHLCHYLYLWMTKDVWLTAFTDGLESLFAPPPTISLRSDSDTIDHEKLLMNITDIDLTYNMKRKVITKISSSSLINCSGLLWRRHAGAHLDGHQHRTNKNICYRVLVQKRELIPLIIHSKYFPDSDWLKAYV